MGSSLLPQSTLTPMPQSNQSSIRTNNLLNLNMSQQMPQGRTQEEINREQILALWSMVKGSNNPQQLINSAMASNPQMKQLMDAVSAFKNPQETFYRQAQEQGVDPNSILNLLR